MHLLASLFAIDICAYAIMSNHYHLVVRLGNSRSWSDRDVVARWLHLFQGPILAHRFLDGEDLSPAQRQTVGDIVGVWRARLEDLSWFMKCLNEPIARQANKEDECTGHFWEARFKSQALKTEKSLISCMAYVDLNPVRAGIARTPEESDYSSIQQRLDNRINRKLRVAIREAYTATIKDFPFKPLLHFSADRTASLEPGIPFDFPAYAQLVDWTGRQFRRWKRGYINSDLPPLLERLNFGPEEWLINSGRFEQIYRRRFSNHSG
ncbi:transposase [Parahaliea mediterranea]|uniref:transposase n=1 Tax=Parahaliea mediterranea TaxID=651086 RepID=UPI001F49D565|nr:transposase [Parahaliea mediterranea]